MPSSRIRKIDDPIPDERSPVVDAHDDGLSVPQMRDPHLGPERQQFVRGGHRIHIIAFAVGRGFSVKIPAVPRGDPVFPIPVRRQIGPVGFSPHRVRLRPPRAGPSSAVIHQPAARQGKRQNGKGGNTAKRGESEGYCTHSTSWFLGFVPLLCHSSAHSPSSVLPPSALLILHTYMESALPSEGEEATGRAPPLDG